MACCILLGAYAQKCRAEPAKVTGCELLENPAKYNGKMVDVQGLAHTDFEHFDMRFPCKGYIQLEVSPNVRTERKFGFRTKEDANFQRLMGLLNGDNSDTKARPYALFDHRSFARVRLQGLFRCHYDFPDCANISRYGDSSLVILSVQSSSTGEEPID